MSDAPVTAHLGPVAFTRLTLETLGGTGLQFRATTGKGHEIPFDTGKTARWADPVETMLSSLGACHAMDVISILRKKRQDVSGYEVLLTGQRRDEHPRAFTAIQILHRVRGRGVSRAAVEEAVRLSEEKYCSVHHSLNPGIAFTNLIEVLEETAGIT